MKTPADKPKPQIFYEKVIDELETVAALIRAHPELNHHAADRLLAIAKDIRTDSGLPKLKPKPKPKK